MTDAGEDLLETLLVRRELVTCLARGPHSKPELVTACEVSRSTVDRGLSRLTEAGIATRAPNGRYELTLFGAVLVRELERVLERMGTLSSVGEVLRDVPAELELPTDLFEDATISHSAGMGVATALAAFADATELRIVNPQLPLVSLGLLADTERFADCEVTVLVRAEMLAELTAVTPTIVERCAAAAIELSGIEESLPFSFAIVDRPTGRRLCLMFGNGLDGLAVIESTTPAAVEWAEALYDRVTPGIALDALDATGGDPGSLTD